MVEGPSGIMTDTTDPGTTTPLESLQRLDDRIYDSRHRIGAIGDELEQVAEPAAELEAEVENTRSRLKEMRVDERRLELSSDEKRERVAKLEERLKGVRNVREESAVSAELDMVRSALDGDEQEALTLLDQIRRMEGRLEEQEEALEEARERIEPHRQELLAEREAVKERIESLEKEREALTTTVDARELRMYERIRAGKGRKAVSRLTPDGACGNCYNVLPLQLQNEVRHGTEMIRCEACGVILAATEPVGDEEDETE